MEKAKNGRPKRYEWDRCLVAGTAWLFIEGEDYRCKPASFLRQIRLEAARRGLRLRTATIPGEGIAVEVYRDETKAPAKRKRSRGRVSG